MLRDTISDMAYLLTMEDFGGDGGGRCRDAGLFNFTIHFSIILPTVGNLAIRAIALLLNKPDRKEQWTWMYLVIAKKR